MWLLIVEDALEPIALIYDIWVHSVEALDVAIYSRHYANACPLHMLFVHGIQEVKDTHNLFLWHYDDGYCFEIKSLCEYDMENGLPCAIVHDMMHHVLWYTCLPTNHLTIV